MKRALDPELQKVFDQWYPYMALLIGSDAGRVLVNQMLQHAWSEGAKYGFGLAEASTSRRYLVVTQEEREAYWEGVPAPHECD